MICDLSLYWGVLRKISVNFEFRWEENPSCQQLEVPCNRQSADIWASVISWQRWRPVLLHLRSKSHDHSRVRQGYRDWQSCLHIPAQWCVSRCRETREYLSKQTSRIWYWKLYFSTSRQGNFDYMHLFFVVFLCIYSVSDLPKTLGIQELCMNKELL